MEIRSDRGWIKAGLAVLVTGVLGGGLVAAACGTETPRKVTADGVTGTPAGAAPAPAAPTPSEDEEKTPDPEVGDKISVGDDGGSVAVTAVEDNVSAGRLFGAGQGNKYIAAEVKGCSGPHEEKIRFEPAYFLLRLDDGTVHDPGAPAKKPALVGGTIPAGRCLSGWVTFTVKEGALATGVIYDGSSRLTWAVPLPKNAKQTTTTTMKPGAVSASETSSTTASSSSSSTSTTARKSSSSSSTTSTTAAKAKPSSTTTSSTKPKSSSGASAGSTSTTSSGTKSSPSTTSSTKPSPTTSSSPAKTAGSSTTSTTVDQE